MGKGVFGLGVGVAIVILGPFACVGDSGTSNGAGVGELGGPCFANGTCSNGLACVLTGSVGKCQLAGDGGAQDTGAADQSSGDTGGGDSSSSDAGPDAADAGPMCAMPFSPPIYPCTLPQIACYDFSSAGQTCVTSSMACMASGFNTPLEFTCFSQKDCPMISGGADTCCASVITPSDVNTTMCPGTYYFGANQGASCGNYIGTPRSCPAGQYRLCSDSMACMPGEQCWPVLLKDPKAIAGQTIGVCVP